MCSQRHAEPTGKGHSANTAQDMAQNLICTCEGYCCLLPGSQRPGSTVDWLLPAGGLPGPSLRVPPALSVSDLCYLAALIRAFPPLGKPSLWWRKVRQQIRNQGFCASHYQKG